MPVRRPPYEVFWDRFAKLYSLVQEKNNSKLYDEVGAFISKHLGKTHNVLEIACGTAQITKRCCGSVKFWEATDFSEKMIEYAGKECLAENVKFTVANAFDLPYDDNSFDIVVIANALHIIPEPQKALTEINRVMKKDGLLIAPTFVYDGADSAKRVIKITLMKSMGFKTFSKWTSVQYREFVEKNGFIVTEQKLFGDEFLPECVLVCKKGG